MLLVSSARGTLRGVEFECLFPLTQVAAANLCCAVDVVENRLRAANEHLLLLSSSSLSSKATRYGRANNLSSRHSISGAVNLKVGTSLSF